MPNSPGKSKELRERRSLERRLFGIGFSQADVALAMDLDEDSVRYDFHRLREKAEFPKLVLSPEESYAKAMQVYLRMEFGFSGERATIEDAAFLECLKRYIDVPRLCSIAAGIVAMMRVFVFPYDEPVYRCYRVLLNELFGCSGGLHSLRDLTGSLLLDEYLAYLAIDGSGIPLRTSFSAAMTTWAMDQYRKEFHLPITESFARVADHALGVLNVREQDIIRRRFGFLSEPQVYREIAVAWNVTLERVRQIEKAALQKLRHPPRLMFRLLLSPDAIADSWVQGLIPVPVLITPLMGTEPRLKALSLSIIDDDLGLSARTYNCLRNANRLTIRSWTEITEAEILRTKNFGRKCMNECKAILAGHGLSFECAHCRTYHQGPPGTYPVCPNAEQH